MSEFLKNHVELDDLVERYQSLRGEIQQRLEGLAGGGDAAQVERLWKELRAHGEFVTGTLNAVDRRPRPEIGDAADVVHYEYDDRGDYCDDSCERGAVIDVNGDKVVIHVAERIIPARKVPARTVNATWNERVRSWVDDESYEFWPNYM